MSSFLVSDLIINKVVNFLYMKQCGNDYIWPQQALADLVDVSSTDAARQLAEDMFTLNVEVINKMYGEGEAEKFRPLDFKYRGRVATAIQAYKALGTWLYQCAEGVTPELSGNWKVMREVKKLIAEYIVNTSEAYEQA